MDTIVVSVLVGLVVAGFFLLSRIEKSRMAKGEKEVLSWIVCALFFGTSILGFGTKGCVCNLHESYQRQKHGGELPGERFERLRRNFGESSDY